MNSIQALEEKIRQSCPSLATWPLKDWLSVVASPHKIDLPLSVEQRARDAVSALYRLSRLPTYAQDVAREYGDWVAADHAQASVLMAYDFHYDSESDRLGLIEVNTNASGYLVSAFLQPTIAETTAVQTRLWDSFCDEMGSVSSSSSRIAIVDENPTAQKMYPEFLMYRDFFRDHKIPTDIWDVNELKLSGTVGPLIDPKGRPISFVYNRWNDFTFATPQGANFARAYSSATTLFSPHPREYLLLADKSRMAEWSHADNLTRWGLSASDQNAISSVLLRTRSVSEFNSPDEIWKTRKSLFFKPARSFGSKSVYRGLSITKKVFERLLQEDTLVQDYLPAPEIQFEGESEPWKYDLRFFVYRDQIQMVAARLYRGQVTNFGPAGGGFAAVNLR